VYMALIFLAHLFVLLKLAQAGADQCASGAQALRSSALVQRAVRCANCRNRNGSDGDGLSLLGRPKVPSYPWTPVPRNPRVEFRCPPRDPDVLKTFSDVWVTCTGDVLGAKTADYGCPHKYSWHYCGDAWNEKIEGTLVVLTQMWLGAYYHFVVDSLTRVSFVQRERPELLQTAFFHVGAPKDFMYGWARLVGLDESRLVGGNRPARLVVWPPSNGCCCCYPVALRRTRELIRRHAPDSTASPAGVLAADAGSGSPVALLMHRAKDRVVENLFDVMTSLHCMGFQVELFSDAKLPGVQQTCASFRRADLVIGMHGAGFSNLLCSRPEVTVVEFHEHPNNPLYQRMAEDLGLRYAGVPSTIGWRSNGTVSLGAVTEAIAHASGDLAAWAAKNRGCDQHSMASLQHQWLQSVGSAPLA